MSENFYERLGGAPAFEKLVDTFYENVKVNDLLKPMYPDQDFAAAAVLTRAPQFRIQVIFIDH